jgi:hypothetical protein
MLGATSSSALALEELDECVRYGSPRGLIVPSTHCIVTTLKHIQTMSTAYDLASTPRVIARIVQQPDPVVVLTVRLQERLSISAQHARAAALVQLRGVLVAQVHSTW